MGCADRSRGGFDPAERARILACPQAVGVPSGHSCGPGSTAAIALMRTKQLAVDMTHVSHGERTTEPMAEHVPCEDRPGTTLSCVGPRPTIAGDLLIPLHLQVAVVADLVAWPRARSRGAGSAPARLSMRRRWCPPAMMSARALPTCFPCIRSFGWAPGGQGNETIALAHDGASATPGQARTGGLSSAPLTLHETCHGPACTVSSA